MSIRSTISPARNCDRSRRSNHPDLQHQRSYLNELDNASSFRCFVAFYVEQRNSVVPHFAFQEQTPDEMGRGTGLNVPVDVKLKRARTKPMQLGPPPWANASQTIILAPFAPAWGRRAWDEGENVQCHKLCSTRSHPKVGHTQKVGAPKLRCSPQLGGCLLLLVFSFVPAGTDSMIVRIPSLERLGYCLPSLSGLRAPCHRTIRALPQKVGISYSLGGWSPIPFFLSDGTPKRWVPQNSDAPPKLGGCLLLLVFSFVPAGTDSMIVRIPSLERLGYCLPSLSGLRAPCHRTIRALPQKVGISYSLGGWSPIPFFLSDGTPKRWVPQNSDAPPN
ncbi:hypothetical protein VN12_11350 [Pirellula sp. SH-Sr6A]|nr:hypothetical protein VN12_11350 [Pirellula sp. SH-Sr6A]